MINHKNINLREGAQDSSMSLLTSQVRLIQFQTPKIQIN